MRETLEEIKAATREGHELLKDMKAEEKKARQVVPMIIHQRVNTAVKKELEILGDETQEAMKQAQAKVHAEFDRMMAILMGEDDRDHMSLPELLDRLGPILPIIRAVMEERVKIGQLNVSDRASGLIDTDLSYDRDKDQPPNA